MHSQTEDPRALEQLRARLILREHDPAAYARLLSGRPEPDPRLERARQWAAGGDPARTVRELFGYRLTPDSEVLCAALKDAFDDFDAGRPAKVIAYGGHRMSKTFIGGAAFFGHYWYACGAEPSLEDGRPRGSLMMLLASKVDQVNETSGKAIREHAGVAAVRGHWMPGYDTLPEVELKWRADKEPLRWGIKARGFRTPAKAVRAPVQQREAGLHHTRGVQVWIEELDQLPEPMWETIRMWSSIVMGCFNPYTVSPALEAKLDSPDFRTVGFSVLRFPPVLERCNAIPGCIDHREIESEMRNVTSCAPLPDGKTPDPTVGHFQYALPDSGVDDLPGPRADGIPGHPLATPQWWAAGSLFMVQRLGMSPNESDALVFSPALLRKSAELWTSLPDPSWAPAVVGVDTAEGGEDRFVLAPQWGRGAVELWLRYQSALDRGLAIDEALAEACRCPDCEGEGCGACWSGSAPLRIGRPREIVEDPDPEEMARRITAPYGTEPRYVLDAGGGGYRLVEPLKRRGCNVSAVHFGGGARQVKGIGRAFRNQRARMYGVLAAAVRIGAAALPPAHLGPLEEELHAALAMPEWVRVETGGEVTWRLPDKADISAALSIGSPDVADAVVLTGADVAKRYLEYTLRTV